MHVRPSLPTFHSWHAQYKTRPQLLLAHLRGPGSVRLAPTGHPLYRRTDSLPVNSAKSLTIVKSERLNWLMSCTVGAISESNRFLLVFLTDSPWNSQSEWRRSFLLSAAFSTLLSIDRKHFRSASWGIVNFAVSRSFATKCFVWKSLVTVSRISGCSFQANHPNDSRNRCNHENLIVNLPRAFSYSSSRARFGAALFKTPLMTLGPQDDRDPLRHPTLRHSARETIYKQTGSVMPQIIMDQGVSACFGTGLAPASPGFAHGSFSRSLTVILISKPLSMNSSI